MRYVRFGDPGNERPGVLLDGCTVLDVSDVVSDFDPNFFGSDGPQLVATAALERRGPTVPLGEVRLGTPLVRPQKIVCIGLNYRQHALESGQAIPDEPIIFMKATNTLGGHNDDVLIPVDSAKTDWEVELAIVIGERCRYLEQPSDAWAKIFGYAISNDVSERHFQLERGGQWDKGKSCETFNPLGPWIATTDEVKTPQALSLWLSVNGEERQRSSTADMIFTIDHIVWYLSQFMVLEPGDIVNTGTPQGVGLGQHPPTYLSPGDVMELGIDGLGVQRQTCRQATRC